MQEVLASQSDYDLANAIENNVTLGSTPFTRRDVRIATIIHDRDVAGTKGKTTKKPSKSLIPMKLEMYRLTLLRTIRRSVCILMSCMSVL